MSVGVTDQLAPAAKPYLAFLEAAGITGTGDTVETAAEPDDETEPVVQEGGHAPFSADAVPILEVTNTSSARSDAALKTMRARVENNPPVSGKQRSEVRVILVEFSGLQQLK